MAKPKSLTAKRRGGGRYRRPSPAPLAEAPRQHGPAAYDGSFPLMDNGEHWFFEDRDVLVLNNRGCLYWTGLVKDGGGYVSVASGFFPAPVMETTRIAAAIIRANGRGALYDDARFAHRNPFANRPTG